MQAGVTQAAFMGQHLLAQFMAGQRIMAFDRVKPGCDHQALSKNFQHHSNLMCLFHDLKINYIVHNCDSGILV